MIKALLGLGCLVTSFLVVPGLDVRDIKFAAAQVFAIALSLAGLYFIPIKRLSNKWFYIFLFYSLTTFVSNPNPEMSLFGMPIGNFWIWQPMYNFLLFGLLIIVIASIDFKDTDLRILFNIMVWCGLIMSLYVIAQHFYIDQYLDNRGLDDLGRIGGTLGNHTHVSPFVAMLIPLALYLRKHIIAIIMCISVFVTTSQVAAGAMIIGLIAFFALKNRQFFINIVSIMIALFLIFGISLKMGVIKYRDVRSRISDNQRFITYEQVIKDVNAKPFQDREIRYPFTGWGMGNFKYTFHIAHREDQTFMRMQQAHNEYLEILYDIGIIGFILFMMMLFAFFKSKLVKFWKIGLQDGERALLSGFIIICITAGGTFIWQIGTTAYFTAIFVGLLYNGCMGAGYEYRKIDYI